MLAKKKVSLKSKWQLPVWKKQTLNWASITTYLPFPVKRKKRKNRKEFSFTSFQRSFTLPESANAEEIDASYKEGILNIIVPKKTEDQKKVAKQIKIAKGLG